MKRSTLVNDVLFFLLSCSFTTFTKFSLQTMPARQATARYCLYRTFVDTYMKAHADIPRKVGMA